jgi:hypothetical protein
VGNCLTIVINSQKGKNPLMDIVFDKRKDYPSFLEKFILPQTGNFFPHVKTQAGKGFQGFFEEKINSTFSTRIKSRVTQLGIV